MAMYANIGGVNKLLAQTFAEGSAGGGGVVAISSSQTMPYRKYIFWADYDATDDDIMLGRSSLIGYANVDQSCIVVLSTGSTRYNYESNKQFAMSELKTDGTLRMWRFCQAGSAAGQTACSRNDLGSINISTNYFTKKSTNYVTNTVLYCISL